MVKCPKYYHRTHVVCVGCAAPGSLLGPRPRPPRSHAAITSSIASDGDRFTVPSSSNPRSSRGCAPAPDTLRFCVASLPFPCIPPAPLFLLQPVRGAKPGRFEGCQDSASPLRAVSGPGRPPLFTLSSQFLARPLVHRFPPSPVAAVAASDPCPASTEAPNSSCSQTVGGCLPD